MSKTELQATLARLESVNDQLQAEVLYLDRLMKMIGFAGGIAAVKTSAREILSEGYLEDNGEGNGEGEEG